MEINVTKDKSRWTKEVVYIIEKIGKSKVFQLWERIREGKKLKLKNLYYRKKSKSKWKINEKKKGKAPFYPTRIFFIFACFLKVSTGTSLYGKFLRTLF